MKTETASRYVAGLALLIFGSTGQAAEKQAQPYVMAVLEDHAHGRLVLEGSDEAAIAEITRGRTEENYDFDDSLALCVAYTRTRQLEAAASACDAAMEKSTSRSDRTRWIRRGPTAMGYTGRSNFALASINRGVLYALTGESEQAAEAFEAALAAKPGFDAAETNLARVSSK
ncbi:MAG: hypothetical protein AAFN50_07670 [Pseudomonadota bacterium]